MNLDDAKKVISNDDRATALGVLRKRRAELEIELADIMKLIGLDANKGRRGKTQDIIEMIAENPFTFSATDICGLIPMSGSNSVNSTISRLVKSGVLVRINRKLSVAGANHE